MLSVCVTNYKILPLYRKVRFITDFKSGVIMELSINKFNVVIDCSDAGILAAFYSKLLGWKWTHPYANGWAAITSSSGTIIAF